MAKQNGLPSIESGTKSSPAILTENGHTLEPIDTLGYQGSPAYWSRLDVKLPPEYRQLMIAKLRKLQDTGARLKDGSEITDKTKCVLWILENEVDVSAG